MTGYKRKGIALEICPKCSNNLIELEVVIGSHEAEEWSEDISIVKKCLICEPEIKKDIIN
ncbi:hypothetical protein LCGC14_2005140 [marine sediment metagenome]|uniref:Uncharacterized protein n=1 Tax=marine sediment metagenome TaxID=412755 RepID=A0A0F9F229_9ZZZZ